MSLKKVLFVLSLVLVGAVVGSAASFKVFQIGLMHYCLPSAVPGDFHCIIPMNPLPAPQAKPVPEHHSIMIDPRLLSVPSSRPAH